MKLNFIGDLTLLEAGIYLISLEYKFMIDTKGIPVYVYPNSKTLDVLVQEENNGALTCHIKYKEKSHFFRGLGLLLEQLQSNTYIHISETLFFEKNGPMIDASRNAVPTTATIKKLLRVMAVMGLNQLALYMEDTFTIEVYPYFGHQQGRYTYDELKSLDDYADIFGIELYPCIQTLAHLRKVLKWDFTKEIQDTKDILLVGSPKTYAFIEEMILSVTKPFRSKRINIGMDEAHLLGLGEYLAINGYKERFIIMKEHLDEVIKITRRQHLEPMIWSDMFFRHATNTEDYYQKDAVIPQEIIESKPDDVHLVYWDYYHHNEDFYRDCIKMHKPFGSMPSFAGGIWTWNSPAVNYTKTFLTTNSALSACKKEGVTDILATMWGDDGNECNLFGTLLGLQLYAEHGFYSTVDNGHLKKRFEFCTGLSYDAYRQIAKFDDTPGTDYLSDVIAVFNPSKYILWQDTMNGLFDTNIKGLGLSEHYKQLAVTIHQYRCSQENVLPTVGFLEKNHTLLFNFYYHLATVLSLKASLSTDIYTSYQEKDIKKLQDICQNNLPTLSDAYSQLAIAHRDLWYHTYRPQGFEVIDIRYGGLIQRVKTTLYRLNLVIQNPDYVLNELEDLPLPFDGGEQFKGASLVNFNQYLHISSASMMGF